MDFISNRTRDIGAMALDGLYERSKAISSNTVNALTPGYKRKEVSFEQSLQDIIKRENEKENTKIQNSAMYQKNPSSIILNGQTPEQISFLNSQTTDGFLIDVQNDSREPLSEDGNNVSIEEEMMDEARNGMQYQVVANLMNKSYKQLEIAIKGQVS